MGLRGPQRTPTAELERRGSWRAKVRAGEPDGPRGIPRCPAWLDDDSKVAWRKVTRILSAMNLLTRADENALVRYCRTFARWHKAEQTLAEHGECYAIKDADGKVVSVQPRPEVAIVDRLAGHLSRLEQAFGLTPAARAGMAVQQPKREQGGIGAMLKVV